MILYEFAFYYLLSPWILTNLDFAHIIFIYLFINSKGDGLAGEKKTCMALFHKKPERVS